jgi:threonine-phosphate decarboxylase
MKPVESFMNECVRGVKPCVHGAEVLSAAEQSGLRAEDILDFSSSVNPLGPSKRALDAALGAFVQVSAYPDSNSNTLRRVIAGHFGTRMENVIVGNGSTELMYLFSEVFVGMGDKVVMPAPTFGEYESAVCRTGERPVFVKLNRDFGIDYESLKGELRGAKVVFLCNPNNPTSIVIPRMILTDIVEEALAQDALVFLDEDFLEFVENEEKHSLTGNIARYPNLFVLRSFTKIYGLTGLRVGYGVGNEEIVNILLRAKIPWNVNCVAQAAAVAALEDEEHLRVTLELIKREKMWLASELSAFRGFRFSMPDANFFFIDVRDSGFTALKLKDEMLRHGFLIRDCSSFRGLDEFFIRVAIKTHEENARLVEAFKQVVKAV